MLDGTGRELVMQRLHEEKMEAEREKRSNILAMSDFVASCSSLARGWSAWVEETS